MKAFHAAFHINTESYLICIYKVDKQPPRIGYPDQINIKATVIEAIQGNKKVGEKFSFERILDGKYGDVSGMAGGLYYVFLYTNDHGKILVSSQDPNALWEYKEEYKPVANSHKLSKKLTSH